MKKEILRLFKGYLQDDTLPKIDGVHEIGLKYGLLIPKSADTEIVEEAIKLFGKDGQKWNQTFHKDFDIVRNTPIEVLVAQQIMHYITTYGFERLGVYNENLVYIPTEKLEVPELDVDNIELIVIKPYTSQQLTEKLMTLLTSGIALSEQTVKDIMVLSDFVDKNKFDEISNREVKIALYDKYNIMPHNPDEFFRYFIFKLTNNTLKIKNQDTINSLKKCDKKKALDMLSSYTGGKKEGFGKLSSIFLRNKDLFLALKGKDNTPEQKSINTFINRLRKSAVHNHKPLEKNILDCLTDGSVPFYSYGLEDALDNITIFREIRILNSILYRLYGNSNIVYKIRNGKAYITELKSRNKAYMDNLKEIYDLIKEHLVDRLAKQVRDKTIYIPKNVVYAAPTSEKQFNGEIPAGSYIEIPRLDEDFIYGIHWTNLIQNGTSERVDLDLKQMNQSEMFGWDASYRSNKASILFSGDVTNAPLPNGATELFYVGHDYGVGAFLVTLNSFTFHREDVPFEFVIAKAPKHTTYDRGENEITKNYVIDPNNIISKVNMKIQNGSRQKVVGLITIGETIKFYFDDFNTGRNVTSRRDSIAMGAFDYLKTYNLLRLKLNDLLEEAGAIIVDSPKVKSNRGIIHKDTGTVEYEYKDADFNLSLETLTKESLIKLLSDK